MNNDSSNSSTDFYTLGDRGQSAVVNRPTSSNGTTPTGGTETVLQEFTIPEGLDTEIPGGMSVGDEAVSVGTSSEENTIVGEQKKDVEDWDKTAAKVNEGIGPTKLEEPPRLSGVYMTLGANDDEVPHYEPDTIDDPGLTKYKVLIIEDNSDVRFQYEFALKKAGFTVVTAKNGEEGIIKAIKEKPQLIVLDILMPEMDGWEVLQVLRKYTSTYRPKILIFSNLGAPEDKEKAIKLGADGFIVKADVTLSEMVDIVKKYLLTQPAEAVFVVPLMLSDERTLKFLKQGPPEVRSGTCPLDGGPLGLKLIPHIVQEKQTGKTIQEYTARIVCLVCGREWV